MASGISKSEVSRICAELDELLEAFRSRPLGHIEFPYVFANATYVKCRVNGRVVSKAVVISDAHEGLKAAIAAVFAGAAWRRCRVHFMRNVLGKMPKGSADMVVAAIKTIFAQPDKDHVDAQLDEIAAMFEDRFPTVTQMLIDAREDLLAFRHFPEAHWQRVWSTNPLERLNW